MAVMMLCSISAMAKVYKWVDEHGVTHYSQKDPKNGAEEMKVKGMTDEDGEQTAKNSRSFGKLDCEKVIKHGIKLMKKKYMQEGGSQANPFLSTLDDPGFIAQGIRECKQESKDPKEAAKWLCQQNATTFDQIKACEK